MSNPKKKIRDRERCSICGDSVKWGSGNFVNRVIDLNDVSTRREMNRKYIWGDYICPECDDKIYNRYEDID